MTAQLVYHPPGATDSLSPFDERAVFLATDADLLIACPYLSLGYLQRLTMLSATWRLLTDIPEWYSSLTQPERNAVSHFLTRNASRVRHLSGLHAKVLVGDTGALVGSANFTTRGITQRTEMGVFLDGDAEIREVREWFVATWKDASPIPTNLLARLAKSLPTSANTKPSFKAFHTRHTRRARLVQVAVPPPSHGGAKTNGPALHEIVASFEDEAWLDDYRKLVRTFIDHLRIDSADPRLVMSVPKRRTGWLLPVSVNNRYIVAARRRGGQTVVGVIHSPDFEDKDYGDEPAYTFGRFDPLPGEDKGETPYFVRLPDPRSVLENPPFLRAALAAAERELGRASASPYRKYHSAEVYEYMVSRPGADRTKDDEPKDAGERG